MSHATCTQVNRGNFRLLVVRSQIANLTPGPSFGHNLCFKCSNGWCKPILDIYVSIAFQWYKKNPQSNGFWPLQSLLKNSRVHWDSNSPNGSYLGSVRVHSLTLSYTPRSKMCLPGLPLVPHSCKPLLWSQAQGYDYDTLYCTKMVVEVNINFHKHINCLVLIMASSLFCVFYVCKFCIQGRRWRWALCFSWFSFWAYKLIYVVVLFFMKPLMKGILIGTQDFERIRSYAYMKKGVSTRKTTWAFWVEKEVKCSYDFAILDFLWSCVH